jgi:hypothetical protein
LYFLRFSVSFFLFLRLLVPFSLRVAAFFLSISAFCKRVFFLLRFLRFVTPCDHTMTLDASRVIV